MAEDFMSAYIRRKRELELDRQKQYEFEENKRIQEAQLAQQKELEQARLAEQQAENTRANQRWFEQLSQQASQFSKAQQQQELQNKYQLATALGQGLLQEVPGPSPTVPAPEGLPPEAGIQGVVPPNTFKMSGMDVAPVGQETRLQREAQFKRSIEEQDFKDTADRIQKFIITNNLFKDNPEKRQNVLTASVLPGAVANILSDKETTNELLVQAIIDKNGPPGPKRDMADKIFKDILRASQASSGLGSMVSAQRFADQQSQENWSGRALAAVVEDYKSVHGDKPIPRQELLAAVEAWVNTNVPENYRVGVLNAIKNATVNEGSQNLLMEMIKGKGKQDPKKAPPKQAPPPQPPTPQPAKTPPTAAYKPSVMDLITAILFPKGSGPSKKIGY